MNNKTQKGIVAALRKVGNRPCLEKAAVLENGGPSISALNLRSLELNPLNIQPIVALLAAEKESDMSTLKTISLSYNYELGDEGTRALIHSFPLSVCEIGMVNCGIGDIGGLEILQWMKRSSSLRMVCMEQNRFSPHVQLEIKAFSIANPHILVVY